MSRVVFWSRAEGPTLWWYAPFGVRIVLSSGEADFEETEVAEDCHRAKTCRYRWIRGETYCFYMCFLIYDCQERAKCLKRVMTAHSH